MSENNPPELRACPFCGAQPPEVSIQNISGFHHASELAATCNNCGASTISSSPHSNVDAGRDATEAWNTRTIESLRSAPSVELGDVVEQILDKLNATSLSSVRRHIILTSLTPLIASLERQIEQEKEASKEASDRCKDWSKENQDLRSQLDKAKGALLLFHIDADHRGLCTPENVCAACLVLRRGDSAMKGGGE